MESQRVRLVADKLLKMLPRRLPFSTESYICNCRMCKQEVICSVGLLVFFLEDHCGDEIPAPCKSVGVLPLTSAKQGFHPLCFIFLLLCCTKLGIVWDSSKIVFIKITEHLEGSRKDQAIIWIMKIHYQVRIKRENIQVWK